VRVLGRQSKGKVGLVEYATVRQGRDAIRDAMMALRTQGFRHAILDAVDDAHLMELGAACSALALITGGSGMALGLPENFRRQGLLPVNASADRLPAVGGMTAVVAGSCSVATLGQIEFMRRSRPTFRVDPMALARGDDVAGEALRWALPQLAAGPVLVYSSAAPEEIARVQQALGRNESGALVERALARIADGLVQAGVRRLVVAGGETSGAVVNALGVRGLRIGPQIDPGVPWTLSMGQRPIALALKSGNFGAQDFFLRALDMVA